MISQLYNKCGSLSFSKYSTRSNYFQKFARSPTIEHLRCSSKLISKTCSTSSIKPLSFYGSQRSFVTSKNFFCARSFSSVSQGTTPAQHHQTQESKRPVALPKATWGKGTYLLALLAALGIVAGGSLLIDRYYFYEAPPNKFTIALDSAIRFTRCATTALDIAIDYKYSLRGLGGEERDLEMKKCHQRSAEKVLKLCQRNGGIFVKLGQVVSSMVYLIPIEYCATLTVLCDKAPYRPFSDIEKVFKEEFNLLPTDMFEQFELLPIASGSLAQVHRAMYKGREVAVKVQYPRLREQCRGDINTVDFLFTIAEKIFPEFKLKWLVDEFNRALPLELDFLHEAQNAERVKSNFKGRKDVAVPETIYEMSTSRILTMEFIRGCKVNDLACMHRLGIDPTDVIKKLTRIYAEQIFFHGFVHCDPHPGNVLLRKLPNKDFQIVLIDNGQYRSYGDEFRLDYARLWLALLKYDEENIKKYAMKIGSTTYYQLFASMLTTRPYENLQDVTSNKKLSKEDIEKIRTNAAAYAPEITGILAKVPSELLLLFKANEMLRALNRELDTNINPLIINMQYCFKAIMNDTLRQNQSLKTRTWVLKERFVFWWQLHIAEAVLWFISVMPNWLSFNFLRQM